MINFSIDSNLTQAIAKLEGFSGRRFKATIATALTRTAKETREAVAADLPREIDRPTEYTRRGLRFKGANAGNLEAEVFFQSASAGSNTAQGKYVSRLIQGGRRAPKKFEKALQARGLMPAGWVAVPGPGAVMDSYGNQSMGQIKQLLSQTRPSTQTAKAKRRAIAKAGGQYFAVIARGRLHPGIWQRTSTGLIPVLFYVQAASYAVQSYKFHDVARRAALRIFPEQLDRALVESIDRVSALRG